MPTCFPACSSSGCSRAAGPTGGIVERPSDGGQVNRIAFIQCVGSRDAARGNGYCSSICCMSATKEAMVALEHAHGRKLEVSIFCMDVRAFGKEFDSYVNRARDEHGVEVHPRHPLADCRDARQPDAAHPLLRPGRRRTAARFRPGGAQRGAAALLRRQGNGRAPGRGTERVRFQPDRTALSAGHFPAGYLRRRGVPGTQGHPRIGGPGLRRRRLRHGPARRHPAAP